MAMLDHMTSISLFVPFTVIQNIFLQFQLNPQALICYHYRKTLQIDRQGKIIYASSPLGWRNIYSQSKLRSDRLLSANHIPYFIYKYQYRL